MKNMRLFTRILLVAVVAVGALAQQARAQAVEWDHQLGTIDYDDARGVATFNNNFFVAGKTRGELGGSPWYAISSPASVGGWQLTSIYMFNEDTGWAVGGLGNVMRTDDGGQTWVDQSPGFPGAPLILDVYFTSLTTGVACTVGGGVNRTTDGGNTWVSITNPATFNLRAVHFVNANTGWISGDAATIMKTTNGGLTWVLQSFGVGITGNFNDVFFVDANTGWSVGGGQILKTTDGGANWTVQASGVGSPRGLDFVDANTGWAAGLLSGTQHILHTTDGGATWNPQTTGTVNLNQIDFVDANTGVAVGASGVVLKTSDGGANWALETTNVTETLLGVYVGSTTLDDENIVVGANGTLLIDNYDAYVNMYNASGVLQWSRQFGTGATDEATAVAANDSGVYVCGTTRATLPGATGATGGPQDVFLRRYDFSGNIVWTRQIGDPAASTAVLGMGSGGPGSVCVVGLTAGTLLGETSSGDVDAWVRFYDESEGLLWSHQFGTSGTDAASGVTVLNGATYVVGGVAGALPGQTHAGSQDIFVRRYDSSDGTEIWTQQFGGAGSDVPSGVAANAIGVFVTGATSAGLPGQTFLGGSNDGVLRACEHATGGELWTREFGTADFDNPRDVIADPAGVVVVGEVATSLPGHSNLGGLDAFALKYSNSGNVVWTNQFGTSADDIAYRTANDGLKAYVVGETQGVFPGEFGLGSTDGFVVRIGATQAPPADVLFVNADATGLDNGTSWTNAFTELRDALLAQSLFPLVDEIWVAGGTYTPTAGTDRSASFQMVNNVALYGGFAGGETLLSQRDIEANPTVLSGNIGAPVDSTDNSYHVVRAGAGIDPSAVLDGFTVGNGWADGGGFDNDGAGLGNFFPAGGSPTITNAVFRNNWAQDIGGAVATEGSPSFTNVVFENNVSQNDGGGVWTTNNGAVTFTDCVFDGNQGLNGGGIRTGGATTFTNALFVNNTAAVIGGAIENFGSATLTNVTVAGNTAATAGPGMRNGFAGAPVIVNSVFWNNTGPTPDIVNFDGITPTISYTLIEGSGGSTSWDGSLGIDGGNNLDADPLLGGNYHLSWGSPAIDGGDSTAANLTTSDLDGQLRVSGATVDMGAFEFQQEPGDVLFSQQFGSATVDNVVDIAADATDFYVVGFVGLFGGGAIPGGTAIGSADSYIIKYDAGGNVLWQDQYGTSSLDDAREVEIDGPYLYIAGEVIGALPGGGGFFGGQDAYIRQYDASTGAVQWSRQFGTATTEIGEGVAAAAGFAYICGRTSGLLGAAAFGGADGFLRQYDAVGGVQWTQQFGTSGEEYAHAVAADPTGAYVTGRTQGSLDGPSSGLEDVFVEKYDTAGVFVWGDQFGSGNSDVPWDIAAFGGGVYVVGMASGSIGGETSNGGEDGFLRKYDASGNVQWTRLMGTFTTDIAYGVGVDASGVYVAGQTFGTFPGEINAGAGDIFAQKYDFDGNLMWTKQYGTPNGDSGLTITPGSLYLGGLTNGDLGGPNAGEADAFFASLVPGPPPTVVETPDVNLTIFAFNAPDSGFVGDDVGAQIQLTIVNDGSENIGTPFQVGLYVSSDATITTGDAMLDSAVVVVGSLNALDSLDVLFPMALLPDGLWGNAFIGAILDVSGAVEETNEADNTASQAIFIDGDTDGDGVLDSEDNCPFWSSAPFDGDGDGCPDVARGGRHVEYRSFDQLPVTYVINNLGAPGIGDGSDFTAIRNSFDTWQNLPGTRLQFVDGGTTAQQDAQAEDGLNLVTFYDPDYTFPAGVIAVGLSTSYDSVAMFMGNPVRPGQIVDSDMIFNPTAAFMTPTAGSDIDLQSVTTHEAAHLVGIAHSPMLTSTMFYKLQPGVGAASLTMEDSVTMVNAYPDSTTLADAGRLKGYVTRSGFSVGVAGAVVFAISATSDDTLGCEYSLPDSGFFEFLLPPDDYYLAIYPLNGSSPIGGITAPRVNELIADNVFNLFEPEYYDAAESDSDDPLAKTPLTVGGGTTTGPIYIITNVDTDPPMIVSVSPDSNATDVSFDSAVLIGFSEPMDILGTVAGNFSLTDTLGDVFVVGQAFPSNDDSVLVFNPSGNLDFSTVYKLRLGTGLSDIYGNGLAQPFVYYFTTDSMPDFAITDLVPTKGVEGAVVAVEGFGLAGGTVRFNGVAATTVLEDTDTRLVVEVPSGATSGPVVVEESGTGTPSNSLIFTLLVADEVPKGYEDGVSALAGVPRSLTLTPDGAQAYVATDIGYAVVDVDPNSGGYLTNNSTLVAGGLNEVDATPDGSRVYAVGQVNRKLYRIDVSTGTVLAEHPTTAQPRGVLVGPLGKRAYVSTDAGYIQIWDVKSGSPTFDQIVGQLDSPDPNIRRKMAIDPAGRFLLALTGTGKVLVFDLAADSFLTDVAISSDPRDVVVDPDGRRCYVTDESGLVNVVSLETFSFVQDIPTGGISRGADITPAGGLLFAVNRELNWYDVIDLRIGSPTFRSVATTIPLRINPVDVAISPDGNYAFSLSEFERQLVSTAIGVGPTITSIAPPAGPEDALVVIAGDGFVDSLVQVSFNGTIVNVLSHTDTSVVVVVPAGATDGPVKVLGTNPTGPVIQSNTVQFDVLQPSGPGGLRLAAVIAPMGGAQFTPALAVSPAGDLIAIGAESGGVQFYDNDPTSGTYGTVIDSAYVLPVAIHDISFTPDGRRAFAMSEFSTLVGVINTNRNDLDFATVDSVFSANVSDSGIDRLAVTPDGGRLLISDPQVNGIQVRDIRPGSPTEFGLIQSVSLFGGGSNGIVREFAIHPGGRYAYLPVQDVDNAEIKVFDLATLSVVNQLALPGLSPREIPISAEFTPDGSRCYIMTSQLTGAPSRSVVILDTSTPTAPAIVLTMPLGSFNPFAREHLRMSPRGDRAVYDLIWGGLYYNDSVDSLVPVNVWGGVIVQGPTDHDFSPDGAQYFIVGPSVDSLFVFDFTGADQIVKVSGDAQTGVVSQPLSQPLVVRVEEMGSGSPVSGVPVTFSVTGGAGMLTTNGPGAPLSSQTVSTDGAGNASVHWTVGPTIGVNTQAVTVTSLGLSGSPLNFTASTVQNPDSLPLMVQSFIPINGKTNVGITTSTLVTFSKSMDPTSVNPSTFFLHKGDMVPIPVYYGFTDNNRKASMTPQATLLPNTTYTMAITAGILGNLGMPLQNPASPTFSTVVIPPPLSLNSVTPISSTAGVVVVIAGTGFAATPANNVVTFNGVPATVVSAGSGYLNCRVPIGAATGPISVTNTVTSQNATIPFTVLVPNLSPVDQVLTSVNSGSATRGTAIRADGAIAYCVSPDANSVVPIDLINQVSLPSIPVGNSPFAIVIDAEGAFAYVTNVADGTVSIIDLATNMVVSTLTVGTAPGDLALMPDGDRLIVVNEGSSSLSIVDTDVLSETHHQVLTSAGTGNSPRGVAITPDGTLIYVGTNTGYLVLDGLNYAVLTSAGSGRATRATAITPDGSLLIVLTTEGVVDIYDIVEGSDSQNQVLVSTGGTGGSTRSTRISPDGALLYLVQEENDIILVVSLEGINGVGVLDPENQAEGGVDLTVVGSFTAGEDPAVIAFDPRGDRVAVVTNPGDNTVSILDPDHLLGPAIDAELRMFPRILVVFEDEEDLRWWQVRYIRAWIELPPESGFTAADIDVSSVRLQGVVPAEPGTKITDVDWDGVDELQVKFDRVQFEEVLPNGWVVPVEVTGNAGNKSFRGETTILTIRPLIHFPKGGEHLAGGTFTTVEWESPSGYDVDSVDVHYTLDDGETWEVIAQGVPDTGSHQWYLPYVVTDKARVLVTLFDGGQDIGSGMSPGAFTIETPVPVTLGGFEVHGDNQSARLEWYTIHESWITGFHVLRSEDEQTGYERVTGELIPASGDAGGASYEYRDASVRPNKKYYYKLEEMTPDGAGQQFGPFEFTWVARFALEQNIPNPFNPTTVIRFTLPEDADMSLVIYDVAGRLVRTLVDEKRQANHYEVQWDGRDASGQQVASGVYFYRIVAGKHRDTKKMLMLK